MPKFDSAGFAHRGINLDMFSNDLEKGVYKNTDQNKKLGRIGQQYGGKGEEEKDGKRSGKKKGEKKESSSGTKDIKVGDFVVSNQGDEYKVSGIADSGQVYGRDKKDAFKVYQIEDVKKIDASETQEGRDKKLKEEEAYRNAGRIKLMEQEEEYYNERREKKKAERKKLKEDLIAAPKEGRGEKALNYGSGKEMKAGDTLITEGGEEHTIIFATPGAHLKTSDGSPDFGGVSVSPGDGSRGGQYAISWETARESKHIPKDKNIKKALDTLGL